MAREAIIEREVSTDKWLVRRFKDGQLVHESFADTKEMAEQFIFEWKSGGGPELINE